MRRALLLVMDSVGCGGAEDADKFGDAGSDTLGHIAEACASGAGDRAGLRSGPLKLPNLVRLGLGEACRASTGRTPPGLDGTPGPEAIHGYGVETSSGKDTPSGHWEIAGVPVTFDWTYFPTTQPTFPKALTDALIREARLPGILGDKHASGVPIIQELGEEHIRTGKPICYTSANSVFQIAAHETHFGLDRLYEVCEVARRLCDPLNVGRVIARPFVGETPETFKRTANRRDYAVPPPEPTILDRLTEAGRTVWSIGKIGDIFAHRGTGTILKGARRQRAVRPDAGGAREGRRRRPDLRQLRRLRFALRPPARRRGLRRRAGGVRCAPAGTRGQDRRRRPGADHRRPRQRPDLDRHRPHPRARADRRLAAGAGGRRHRPAGLRRHRRDGGGASGARAREAREAVSIGPRPPLRSGEGSAPRLNLRFNLKQRRKRESDESVGAESSRGESRRLRQVNAPTQRGG